MPAVTYLVLYAISGRHVTSLGKMRSMLAEPVPCTVIEEVGSTGVGAMALAFIILAVATVIFLAKAWGSPEHKRFVGNCLSCYQTMQVYGWTFSAATI
jgi:hypothetical protein